jgi:integrase
VHAEQKRQQQSTDYYQWFLNSLSNLQTKAKYDFELNCYRKYLGLTSANELITPDLIDSPAAIREVDDQIIRYIQHLHKTEKLAPATISLRLSAILYFYMINRINVNRKYISRFKSTRKRVRKGDLTYNHRQVQQILSKANKRDRMIILLMASTGMRIGALPHLTIDNLHKLQVKGYPPSLHIYKIIVYEGEPEEYYTFTTFECAAAIDDYLMEREHFGEHCSPESPLIRAEYNYNIPERVQKPEFLTTGGMQRLLDRLLIGSMVRVKHVGRREGKGQWVLHNVMKSHGFRKFTITQMKLAKVDFSDREYLVGHKGSRGLDVNYDRTSEDDRLQEYLKAMDLLTINDENRLRRQVQEQDHTIKVQMAKKEEEIQMLLKWKEQMEVLLNEPDKFIQMLQEGRGRSK